MAEWVRVEEGLPEEGEHVFAYSEGYRRSCREAWLDGGQWHMGYIGACQDKITHWMPMPDAPEPAKPQLQHVCEALDLASSITCPSVWEGMPKGRFDWHRDALLWRILMALTGSSGWRWTDIQAMEDNKIRVWHGMDGPDSTATCETLADALLATAEIAIGHNVSGH